MVIQSDKKSPELKLHKIASIESNDPKSFKKNIKKLLALPDDGPSNTTHTNGQAFLWRP